MFKNKQRYLISVVFGVALMVSLGANSAFANNSGQSSDHFSESGVVFARSDLSVGDVIANGVSLENGDCDVSEFSVETTAIGDGQTLWLGVYFDSDCQVVVNAKWEGALEDGPPQVVDPLLDLLSAETESIPEETATNDGAAFKSQSIGLSAFLSSSKTSEQQVFMYGAGGQGDKLTKKNGKITFFYNGSTATITSESGTCQGSSPLTWDWLVDSCVRTGLVPGPASTVSRSGRGNYHCSPTGSFPCNLSNPNGYYHSLYDTEDGHASGTSHCTYTYTGKIVSGVNNTILQGCN